MKLMLIMIQQLQIYWNHEECGVLCNIGDEGDIQDAKIIEDYKTCLRIMIYEKTEYSEEVPIFIKAIKADFKAIESDDGPNKHFRELSMIKKISERTMYSTQHQIKNTTFLRTCLLS